MELINIDYKGLLDKVIMAYSYVYGEQYRPIISERLKKTLIISYINLECLKNYVLYLERCKTRELYLKFLDEIGVNIDKYKRDNFSQELEKNLSDIISNYLFYAAYYDNSFFSVPPIYAFDDDKQTNSRSLLETKIKIINYILRNEGIIITKDNYESFTKTEKYLEVLRLIEEYKRVHNKLLAEYNDFLLELKPTKEYLEKEEKRLKLIYESRMNRLADKIYNILPSQLEMILGEKSIAECRNIIAGDMNVSRKLEIEFFSNEEIDKIMSSNIGVFLKSIIVDYQVKFLSRIGIDVPIDKENTLLFTEDDFKNYLELINQDGIKEYIPTQETINLITKYRLKEYDISHEIFYNDSDTVRRILKIFPSDYGYASWCVDLMKKTKICISGRHDKNGNYFPVMFITIREEGGATIDFIHECGHAIDINEKGCGFEINHCTKCNPYLNNYRKYERFNETITDMFMIEVLEYLASLGIYLIEPKEFMNSNIINVNTFSIDKEILRPLVTKYREYVIASKIESNPEILIEQIGRDNYEDLVDALNKVDYLAWNGLLMKLGNNEDDPLVQEYFEQLHRVGQIYKRIDNHSFACIRRL